ncbi:MAG: MBL fold metallo-hydrolase, partial [bacterium]|nr:MBL fold metallo-hydrolase [bacterium]
KQIKYGWLASSTVTFAQSIGKNIIVDPGGNRKKLIEELLKNNLKPSDIDFVLLTHGHTDHILLSGIFENARVLNNEEIYDNDEQVEHNNKIPETDLEIIQTLGHSNDHCSLVVKTNEGIYVVAGDVFWWTDGQEQRTAKKSLMQHKDPYVKNEKELGESRRKILEIADYIIPGHGKMFKVME